MKDKKHIITTLNTTTTTFPPLKYPTSDWTRVHSYFPSLNSKSIFVLADLIPGNGCCFSDRLRIVFQWRCSDWHQQVQDQNKKRHLTRLAFDLIRINLQCQFKLTQFNDEAFRLKQLRKGGPAVAPQSCEPGSNLPSFTECSLIKFFVNFRSLASSRAPLRIL